MKNPFLEQQKELIETWTENISKVPGMEAYADMYKQLADQPVEFWESLSENAVDPNEVFKTFTQVPGLEAWSNLFSGPMGLGDFSETFKFTNQPIEQWNKLFTSLANPAEYWKNLTSTVPGMDVYNEMMSLWKDLQNPEEFAKTFPQKYNALMQTVMANFMPAGVGPFLAQPTELMDSLIALYQYLFSPWMKIDENIFTRIAQGDASAYVDFFREFQDRYKDTFKKVFNMMGMGLNRESNEDVLKLLDAYFQALYATGELIALIYNTWQRSSTLLVDKYQEMLKEGKTITTFKEFYDLWFSVTEAELEMLFDTDEFAETFGHFSDMYAKYMIASNKVVERMLAPLPIPTKKDMDSLYRTVYDLRKEVRDIRRQLKDLEAKVNTKSTSTRGKKK